MTESTGHAYLKSHDISGPALRVNIQQEARDIAVAADAAAPRHAGKTLVRDGPLRIVIIGLKAGSTIAGHRTDGPLSLHVIAGQVEVTSDKRKETLDAGMALVFGSSVSHALKALADSVALLTIAWPA